MKITRKMMKIFVGISGASGVDLGLCLLVALEKFTDKNDEIFAVISKGAKMSFLAEKFHKSVNFSSENPQKNVNFLKDKQKNSQKNGTKKSVNFLEKNENFAKNSRQNKAFSKDLHPLKIHAQNSQFFLKDDFQKNFLQNLPTNDEFVALLRQDFGLKKTHFFDDENLAASIASGSFGVKKSIIAPCSLNTLAKIRRGLCDTLITRCAAVALKERKCLVLGVRESPLSAIALKQMFKLAKMGVIIAPPMFAGYACSTNAYLSMPCKDKSQNAQRLNISKSIDIRDFVIGKWLDSLDIPHTLYKKWDFGL